jgi:hypothetical protein
MGGRGYIFEKENYSEELHTAVMNLCIKTGLNC